MPETIDLGNEAKKQALAGKYLTFKLNGEEYGVEILKVQEIIKMMKVTPVPNTPDEVRGVINLRGQVIPIVDLRQHFEMDSAEATEKSCIIVTQVATDDATVTTGAIVDEVSEVLNILPEEIEEAPTFGASVNTSFILGIAKARAGVKILLDVDKVLGSSASSAVAALADAA
jgi:purine-binding chemotaxis protein CheW